MRTLAALALTSLAACSGWGTFRAPVPTDPLRIEGQVENGPLGFSAADLARLKRQTVRGIDPRTGKEAAYAGVAVAPFFDESLPLVRGADTAFFHGKGGYVAAVPLNALRQSQPVLADEIDGKPIAEARPDARPFLLAWPSAEAPGLTGDQRQRWYWVAGVERIEVGPWQETVGRATRVPVGASSDARLGSDVFARQCIQCHKLRSRGGTVGPELTRVATERPAADLAALLASHLGSRPGMVGTPDLPPAAAQQVAAFLRAVALVPERPEDEVRPPTPRPPQPRPRPGEPPGRPTDPLRPGEQPPRQLDPSRR